MLRGIYTSASGMIVQMEKEDVISNNLANVDTTGYKKDQTIIKEFPKFEIFRKDDERVIIGSDIESKLTSVGGLGTGAVVRDVFTKFDQGTILQTGNNNDFAISGQGFFAVETSTGAKLTRSGNFYIDLNNYLVDSKGNKVLAVSGENTAGYIKVTGDLAIHQSGEISGAEIENSNRVYNNLTIQGNTGNSLATFEVLDKNQLIKQGDNYYSLAGDTRAEKSINSLILQGSLEKGNVSVIKEMVEMIQCSRSYETNQKVLTSQDETLNKIVTEVGRWA
jgi:flagellar basal-body rod protein FlgF